MQEDSEFVEKLESDMLETDDPHRLFRITAMAFFAMFLLLEQRFGHEVALGYMTESVNSLSDNNTPISDA